MTQEEFNLIAVFGVVALLAYGLSRLFLPAGKSQLERRLQGRRAPETLLQQPGRRKGPSLLNRLVHSAGKPFEPKTTEEQSALRRQLGQAGIYSTASLRLISGAKAIALGGGLLGGYLLGLSWRNPWFGLAIGGLMGYMLPATWLRMRIQRQQKALEHGLPDALDLMVVCVEAGLTLDAAMQRVGREINLAYPELARELAFTHMETQMGLPRADALRNLGKRTGSRSLQSLSAMLIQAERFGTSIAQSLRTHAESLRIKRQYAAEEKAAKAAVKMTVPLVFCVFPAMMVVIGGPAIMKMKDKGLMGKKSPPPAARRE